MKNDNKKILLSHGGGGQETSKLINEIIFKELYGIHPYPEKIDTKNVYRLLEDSAVLNLEIPKNSNIAFTTDSFTVTPIFFKGGDIGKLCVAGTVNDLSVMGAKPLFLSLGLIIEEGFPVNYLKKIIKSVSVEANKSGVKIVTGDTKVVPRGKVDGIFINTSGIGKIIYKGISAYNIKDGDLIIASGNVGNHGAAIMAEREGIDMDIEVRSDCASLWHLIEELLNKSGPQKIKAIRDATRGGLSAVLNEWASASEIDIFIEESKIPVKKGVRGFCDLLGLEPWQLACEGTVVLAVDAKCASTSLEIIKSNSLGKNARVIGFAGNKNKNGKIGQGRVIIKGIYGVDRLLDFPSGELLPRIC